MKISGLTGKDLDRWVAKAQGWIYCESDMVSNKPSWKGVDDYYVMRVEEYTPSTSGGQCFELIAYLDTVYRLSDNDEVIRDADIYGAEVYGDGLDVDDLHYFGPTLNIAICRTFVASVYGEEVSDDITN